jgi:hypothetical protein
VYNSINDSETFTDGVGEIKMSGDNTDDDTIIEEPDVADKNLLDTTMIVVGGRNILQVQAGNPTQEFCSSLNNCNKMELTNNMLEKITKVARESKNYGKVDLKETPLSSTGSGRSGTEGRNATPLDHTLLDHTPLDDTPLDNTLLDGTALEDTPLENTSLGDTDLKDTPLDASTPSKTEIKNVRFHYNKEVLTIPDEGEKANMMTEVLGKHSRLVVNTHTTAKSKQLKARQWIKLRSGLYGWKVKAAKAKSSSTNNGPAPNSAKQKPIVTTQTNPIQKISNNFGKYIHTSDIVAGNDESIRGLSAFRVQGSEGQHGLSEQQQPED